jgi:uncharacterized protein YndB with AHSA1/START domain
MPQMLHEIDIAASPARVYEALTTQKGVRSWWTAGTVMDEHVGGKADFGFDGGAVVFRMKIVELTPGKRVVWACVGGDNPEWKGTRLSWDISKAGRGSLLRFTHARWRKASHMFAICNSTWGELVHRLKATCEGARPGPHWTK